MCIRDDLAESCMMESEIARKQADGAPRGNAELHGSNNIDILFKC